MRAFLQEDKTIEANSAHGVLVSHGSNNNIAANFIGTVPANPDADLGNGGDGVRIINGATGTYVGSNKIGYPAYSADGSRIWFSSNRSFISNFEIFSMNANGTNQLQLTTNPAADTKPAR